MTRDRIRAVLAYGPMTMREICHVLASSRKWTSEAASILIARGEVMRVLLHDGKKSAPAYRYRLTHESIR